MAEKELREKQEIVKSGYYLLWYSGDDWTLPEYDEKGNSLRMQPSQWMLKNDNQLPPLVVSRNPEDESGVRVPNETGMNAVKQEILSGHGVMVTYKAGDRFSVITTTDYTDDDGKRISYYSVPYNSESPDTETVGQTYAKPGESFVMESGEWQDWTKAEKPEEEDSEEYDESFPIDPLIKVYDNFCIKVFFRKQQ